MTGIVERLTRPTRSTAATPAPPPAPPPPAPLSHGSTPPAPAPASSGADPARPSAPIAVPPGSGHPTHPGPVRAGERSNGLFAPWSPCEPETCLPSVPRGGLLRMARRAAALAAVLTATLAVAVVFPLVGPQMQDRILRRLLGGALRAAGVRLEVSGATGLRPDDGSGALVVANHMSWIDVLALGAVTPVTMLAKREVAQWPVIGSLARRVGTLFVDREGWRTLPGVVTETSRVLRGGALVGVFPEATTWCGAASGEFRRAPFQAAIDAGVPVRPVSFALRTPDGRPTTAASFVGDQTLGDSLGRVLRMPGVVCAVVVGAPIDPAGHDRRTLARLASSVVRASA